MKDYKIQSIFITIIVLLICIIICFKLDNSLKNIVNYFTITGTTLSVLGLYFTYMQILSIKSSNEAAVNAVNQSINRINQILNVSDISKSIQNITEIQNYLKNEQFDLALLRMKDIKILIISVKYITALKDFTTGIEYSNLLQDFQIDLNNINNFLQNMAKKPNLKTINLNLENLSTKLSEFENHLKNLSNG